ncbi:MAG: outer membrane lipoprotein carrier protein LolA [bacterium]|nr:outer membrane lipoprotein carrier protein LolA [bacterium]
MTTIIRFVVCATVVCVAVCAWAEESSSPEPPTPLLAPGQLDALLDDIEHDLSGLERMGVRFRQKKHLAIFSKPVKAEGLLLFRRPADLRFEIVRPFHSVLVVHGKSVAKYERMDGEWVKLRHGAADALQLISGRLTGWLQGKLRDETGLFEVQATSAEPKTVRLVPGDPKLARYIGAIELHLTPRPYRIESLTIREQGTDRTEIVFFDEVRNLELPDAYFDVKRKEPLAVDLPEPVPAE